MTAYPTRRPDKTQRHERKARVRQWKASRLFVAPSDPLKHLAAARTALLANKARDFAAAVEAERPGHRWGIAGVTAIDAYTGKPYQPQTREDFNASRRAFERSHSLLPAYDLLRIRAGRRVSGLAQADMLASATRCATQAETTAAAWRAAA